MHGRKGPAGPRPTPLPARRPEASAGLLAAGLAVLTVTCGREPGPRWIDLARGFEPASLFAHAEAWTSGADSSGLRAVRDENGGGVWIEATLPRGAWSPGDVAGTFWAERPQGNALRFQPDGVLRLVAGERSFLRLHDPTAPEPGRFFVDEDRVHVALEPGGELPAELLFGLHVENGAAFDGVWRMRDAGRTAAGFPVWSGAREELRCDVPARATLQCVVRWRGSLSDAGEPPRFRVLLDGTELHAGTLEPADRFLDLVLPEEGAPGAVFAFEVDGPPGQGLFLVPRIVPTDRGTYRDRPWGEDRPDVVLFLADTYRADNLALYGGDPGTAPSLNAFAARSVRFLQARTTSSWTLPSISSLLTGLQPGQHDAREEDRILSYDLTTIAETFAAHGYRTGAVTDAAFFANGFGLDQGFAWFAENGYPDWNVDRTVREAAEFLDRDDGRPLFLIVHSYRAHEPYRTGPEEDLAGWQAAIEEGNALLESERGTPRFKQRVHLAMADTMRALYRDGSHDLDRAFGVFLADLERRGLLETGHLVFTSDHGEAFGENGDMGHGRDLWDVKVRVPLLIAGRELEPRDVHHTVSLVDLAPTLAALAALPREESWNGASLLEADEDRTSYSFLLEETRRQVTIVEGERKLFALPDAEALRAGDVLRCFDLAADPAEEHEVSPEWADTLSRSKADEVEELLLPRATAGQLGPAAADRPDLRDIGYGGE